MGVLTQEDRDFFDENGYVIVREAAPKKHCEAVVDAVFSFLGFDPDDPNDWYRAPHRPGAGMVEMYQHPAMWQTRQSPRIHQAYSELWGTEKLWTSLDRVNFKPPRHPDHPEWDHKGMFHWDADVTKLPLRFGTQGVLFLRDTASNQGSFVCIPGAHKTLIREKDPYAPKLEPELFRQIPANQGDLLIWHRALPHGNGRNASDKPRIAQYINQSPAPLSPSESAREGRVALWRERRASGYGSFRGDARGWEAENYGPAPLSPLGRKLLGLDLWE
ncbi:MAG: phytanoyl-CoA dioxygenase family protein [Candidatus Poribacteria bacterium]|nr:phytanoyl-CoA dioxygenase family protein [Candidatus Poribacteria bacterium]